MSDDFVGLTVLVTLHNGQPVEGTIEAVGRDSNLLLLTDAVMRLPKLELTGEQIASIKVLSGVTFATPAPPPKEPPTWQQSSPSSPISGNRRPKQVTPQKTTRRAADWSKDDVQRYKSKEFDFQANLGLFDKKKIFKEIQEMDETRPEERLVAHNLSQRKIRHDQNVLERPLISEDDDQIVLEAAMTTVVSPSLGGTTITSSSSPSAAAATSAATRQTQPKGVPCVDASLLTSIEQQVLSSGTLSNEQVIENAARSLIAFLFDQDAQDPQIFSRTILLLLSPDRMGVYALAVGRHLLNRGYHLAALPPVDTRLAPSYFNAALRQFGKFGGEMVTAVKDERRYSLVISCINNTPALRTPVCALVLSAGATWNVRFGLPSELPSGGGPAVVCDVGWPPALVDAILGGPWKYSSTFGNASYIVIRTK